VIKASIVLVSLMVICGIGIYALNEHPYTETRVETLAKPSVVKPNCKAIVMNADDTLTCRY
jgi:hypothetical protein